MTDNETKYWAFLSYSHQDNRAQRADTQTGSRRCWGDWLHDALKTFSIPAEFAGQINGRGEIIPERIDPIFRDEQELPEAATLSAETRKALEQSICLIVICSPRSAKSHQVNEAVRYFKQLGRGQHILPIVVAGEPQASDGNQPGRSPEDECFVPALRHPVSPDGTLDTTRRAGKSIFVDARHGVDKREILAQDHRHAEADLEMAKIQLIALLLGVGFNGLWWREQKRHFFDFAEAQHQAREALNQVEEVRRQLQEAQRQTRDAQNQALEIQNLPRDVHSQIQAAQNQALEAQNQAREAQKQLQEFQNQVRDTQTQLEAARHRALAAESKVLEAQQQVRETQNQIEETRNQAREAQNKIQEIQSETRDAQGQIQAAQSKALEEQNQAQNAQGQLEETRQQAQEAEGKFLEAQSQVQEFQNQARSAQSQLEAARHQASEAQGKVLAAEHQAREAQHQVQEIQNQTRDAQSQIQAAQNQVQKIQDQGRNARRLTKVFALLAALALLTAGLAASIAWRQRQVASQALAKAAAAAAGKFDLASGALDQEQIRQALRNIGGAEQAENRRRSLDELAARIPTEEIPEALKASLVIVDDQPRSHFQKWLLVRLGWVNPLSAMTCASAMAGKIVNDEGLSDSSSYFQLAVLDNWLQTDLTGASNWVRQLPDAECREWLAKLPAGTASEVMVSALLAGVVEKYPAFAWQWTQSLTDETRRQRFQLQIARQWMKADPFAALNWINRLDLPQTIMPPRKAAWPWEKFLLESNFDSQAIVPVETEVLSNPTNGPVQIQPKE